jgi:hypothetical protein
MTMLLERLQDKSVIYWMKALYPSGVTVSEGWNQEELVVPTLALENKTLYLRPFELGNRKGLEDRYFYIDIFAVNKPQRDEFSYTLFNELQNYIPVYNYNQGFPPIVSPSQIGILTVSEVRVDYVKVIAELVTQLYYRATVHFVATYNPI